MWLLLSLGSSPYPNPTENHGSAFSSWQQITLELHCNPLTARSLMLLGGELRNKPGKAMLWLKLSCPQIPTQPRASHSMKQNYSMGWFGLEGTSGDQAGAICWGFVSALRGCREAGWDQSLPAGLLPCNISSTRMECTRWSSH